MKLLLVQHAPYIPALGGGTKVHKFIVESLAKKGHQCRVLTPMSVISRPDTRTQFIKELSTRGIRVIHSSDQVDVFQYNNVEIHNVTNNFYLRKHLSVQLRGFDPDWVIISSEDPGYGLLRSTLEVNNPRIIYSARTTISLPFGPASILPNATATNLLHRIAGIITNSQFLRNYIRQWGGLESIVMDFPVYGEEPFPFFGYFDQGFVTMVNPCAYKGISIFLEIARQLSDVQFAAVPTWGTTSKDQSLLVQLPNMHFLPPSDNIDDIFAQTRVLIVPSIWAEAFGRIVVEAMLRGIPVLASNAGGLPEAKLGIDYTLPVHVIEKYEPDLNDLLLPIPLVPPQDVSAWITALNRILKDRVHYERLSAASRNAALHYISGLSITPFEDFLQECAS